MKKISLAVVLFTGLLISCGNKKAETPVATDTVADSVNVVDESNARNSLDWAGTYKGILPAADAEGMDVTIVITDSTFTKTYSYVGKKNKPIIEKGAIVWSADGNTITLTDVEAPNQYFVSEGKIIQLDASGNPIEGEIANQYVLTQVPAAE